MTSQPSGYPSGPAHRPTVAKLTGIKRRGVELNRMRVVRKRRRSLQVLQLLCFQWFYERTGAQHALFQLRTGVEARSAPVMRSLGDLEAFQEIIWEIDDVVGAP